VQEFSFLTNVDEEQRSRIKTDFIDLSQKFAIASSPSIDLILLLARSEREQRAVAKAVA
jgi:hypothetical protein